MIPKNILLIEPGYLNKYPPLGLMKLAAYHGPNGRADNVTFVKGEDTKSTGNGLGSSICHYPFQLRVEAN